jgi:hypothetical protein
MSGFDRLKDLLGTWKGKDAHGNSVDVTYTCVADSTAIMESLDIGASRENMVTVYTLSSGNTLLTLTFKDKDHFSQEWILRIEWKDNSTVYEFERVKPAEQSSGW